MDEVKVQKCFSEKQMDYFFLFSLLFKQILERIPNEVQEEIQLFLILS